MFAYNTNDKTFERDLASGCLKYMVIINIYLMWCWFMVGCIHTRQMKLCPQNLTTIHLDGGHKSNGPN